MPEVFSDRADAGRRLAAVVRRRVGPGAVVLGLPRGGVPVAAEVARAVDAPLDVMCARKLGSPGHREFAMGAISEADVCVLDVPTINRLAVSESALREVVASERRELDRQMARFRGGRDPVPLEGREVVVVDDGLATGATARAAIEAARRRGARRVVLAVPVAAPDSVERVGADEVLTVITPPRFRAVGEWYDHFEPTTDDEVVRALREHGGTGATHAASGTVVRSAIEIPIGSATLGGWLDVPTDPKGIVVFVHGSGSSRHSSRNQAVAAALNAHGFATLLFDLLTERETADRGNVFDTRLLARRLAQTLDRLATRPDVAHLPVMLFGASTGAAAALRVAADPSRRIAAVVSRGGRPDLAEDALGAVRCPVLLIVGGADRPTLAANEQAAESLRAPHTVEIVPDAGHLFEEPGALEAVARLAARWFERHVAAARVGPRGGG